MDTTELKKEVKRLILTASFQSQACHLGSAMSASDIIVDLYFNRMKENDIFIFGKASGVAALYATLAVKGVFPKEKVAYYLKRYPLPDSRVKGVNFSCGSLGHAAPYAAGLAYANRTRDVYCLVGDGCITEGTTWEVLLFAKQHKLNNLKIIWDRNGVCACGYTKDVLDASYAMFLMSRNIFYVEIVDTKKGSGVSFLESYPVRSHYLNLTEQTRDLALSEIC